MVAFDAAVAEMQDFEPPRSFRERARTLKEAARPGMVMRALMAFVGCTLIAAAVGLWALPAEDSAMRLIKLLVSLTAGAGGAILLRGLDRDDDDRPQVELDVKKRQLRIYEYDCFDRTFLTGCHDLDDLFELELKDGILTARDDKDLTVVSIELPSRRAEKRIRAALG